MNATLPDAARRLKRAAQAGCLPRLILVTDIARLPDPEAAVAALPAGSAVIVRHPDAAGRRQMAERLARPCRDAGVRLLVAADPDLATAIGADGLHLPDAMVRNGPRSRWRRRHPDWLVTAAAHSPAALRRAAATGADAALLSPVFATRSHPGAPAIGPLRFAAWVGSAPLPVYALGGVTAATARRLSITGVCGFAAIDGLSAPL